MKLPRAPYEELTDPANADVTAMNTFGFWRGRAALETRTEFFKFIRCNVLEAADEDVEDLPPPSENLLKIAVRTSGAIGGAHRADLTTALTGQKPAPVPFVIQDRQEGREGL